MKRAVVTGGAGFLGSHIADTLEENGYEVCVFDQRPSPHLRGGQEMVVGDIMDSSSLDPVLQGAHAVFHLAGLADLNQGSGDPHRSLELNVRGTLNALESARKAGVGRFVFASTVYVYSRAGGFYRCSKQACESFIEEYQRQYDLPFTILRYGSLYGPRADDTNGVFRLLKQAAHTGRIHHVGSPEDSREYLHVEDAARLSVEALSPEFENSRVVVTGHYPMRLTDLFTMFSEILGRSLEIDYAEPDDRFADSHYRVTPYAYNSKVGRKLTSNLYVDMGQGLLQVLENLEGQEQGESE